MPFGALLGIQGVCVGLAHTAPALQGSCSPLGQQRGPFGAQEMALGACAWPSDSSPGAARVWTVGVNQRRETELQLMSPAPGGSLEDETGQG